MKNRVISKSKKSLEKQKKTTALVLCMPFLVFLLVLIRDRLELLALFLGLFWETYKIIKEDKDWHIVLFFTLLGSCIASVGVLVDKGIEIIAYAIFLLVYALIIIYQYKPKINIKITEGTSLLCAISFIYWLIDFGWFQKNGGFTMLINLFIFLYLLLVLVNVISDFDLSKTNRFWMSLGATIMIAVMAIDNYHSVFALTDVYFSILDRVILGLQYFFIGVSAIYIVRNFTLLYHFLPEKGESYRKSFKENVNDHINRFSTLQIKPMNAVLCFIYCFLCYYTNYQYDLLPRNLMIWLVIFSFPFLISFIDRKMIK